MEGDTPGGIFGTRTGSHGCSGAGKAPLLSAGTSPRCGPPWKSSLVPSTPGGLQCPGTGLTRECHQLLMLALAGDTTQPPHPRVCRSPAGLCRGTLGTAECVPRKTPCA